MAPPRRRSCSQCRFAKTRCSLTTPHCSRCLSRNLKCDYGVNHVSRFRLAFAPTMEIPLPANTIPTDLSDVDHFPEDPYEPLRNSAHAEQQCAVGQTKSLEAIVSSNENDYYDPINLSIDTDQDNREAFAVESDSTAFNADLNEDSNADVIESLSCQSKHTDSPMISGISAPSQSSSVLQRQWSPDFRNTRPFWSAPDSIPQSLPPVITQYRNLSYPPSPWSRMKSVPTHVPGILTERQFQNSSLLGARYILGILKSFPSAVLSGSSLPSFIHPQCSVDETRPGLPQEICANELFEPLAICFNLIHMWSKKTLASSTFVWRTIHLEQQRLYHEVSTQCRYLRLHAIVLFVSMFDKIVAIGRRIGDHFKHSAFQKLTGFIVHGI